LSHVIAVPGLFSIINTDFSRLLHGSFTPSGYPRLRREAILRKHPNQEETTTMSDVTNGSPEEILRNRFASGEIDAVEYERSLKAVKGESSIATGRSKARLLAVGIAAVALLAVGGGAVYAQGQGSSMMGGDAAESETDGNGMGSMMNGG